MWCSAFLKHSTLSSVSAPSGDASVHLGYDALIREFLKTKFASLENVQVVFCANGHCRWQMGSVCCGRLPDGFGRDGRPVKDVIMGHGFENMYTNLRTSMESLETTFPDFSVKNNMFQHASIFCCQCFVECAVCVLKLCFRCRKEKRTNCRTSEQLGKSGFRNVQFGVGVERTCDVPVKLLGRDVGCIWPSSCLAAGCNWNGVVKLVGGIVQAVSLCSGLRGHVRPDPVAWRRLGLHRSRTTHQDKICRSSQDTSFLRFSVMTHMSRHIVVAPILSAPLLTDTRRSTVGPGMREDIACVVGGVLQLLLRSQRCARGGVHRASSCSFGLLGVLRVRWSE